MSSVISTPNGPTFNFLALIEELLDTGREATDAEITMTRHAVSASGFDPLAKSRVRGPLVGATLGGHVLARGDMLPNDVWHYVKHVVVGFEWPAGTTMSQYISSLREVINDASNPILLDVMYGIPRLTFFGPGGSSTGPEGGEWILVGYDVH